MSETSGTARGALIISPVGLGSLLAGTMAISSMMVPLLSVLSGPIIDEFGLSRSQFGWLLTASAMSAALVAPSSGKITDRRGGRFVLLCLLALAAGVLLSLSLVRGYVLLLALSILGGVPNGAGNPATNKLIMQLVPRSARGTTLGVKQSGVQLGFLVAGLALPFLSVQIGWRAAVAVAAIVPVAGFLASMRLPADAPKVARSGVRSSDRIPPEVWWVTAYALLMGTVNASVISFLPLYAREVFGMGLAQAGSLVSALGLVGIVGRIVVARHVGRTERYAQGLATMGIASAVAVAAVMSAPAVGTWLLWAAAVVAGASVAGWNALAHLTAVSITPEPGAGRASGAVAAGFLVGFSAGPVLLGYTVDVTGSYRPGWSTIIVLCGAALLTLRPLFRSPQTNGSSAPKAAPAATT